MNMSSGVFKYIIIMLLVTNSVHATGKPVKKAVFIAGEHFQILPSKISSKVNSNLPGFSVANTVNARPKMIVFFNYGCFGCKHMNQYFNKWKKGNQNKIDIIRYPVSFNKPWENLSKLYYVTQELLPQDDGEAIFKAIYEDNKKLWLETEMIAFYEQRSISKEQFLRTYNSFAINRQIKQATEIANNYTILVTPNIIIVGKNNSYMVNFTMVQDPQTLFKVVDYLIANNPTK